MIHLPLAEGEGYIGLRKRSPGLILSFAGET